MAQRSTLRVVSFPGCEFDDENSYCSSHIFVSQFDRLLFMMPEGSFPSTHLVAPIKEAIAIKEPFRLVGNECDESQYNLSGSK